MLFGDPQDVVQLAHLLNYDDHAFSGLGPGESQGNELFVLKAIQHQQTVRSLFQCQRGVELGFRSRFQAEVVSRTFT